MLENETFRKYYNIGKKEKGLNTEEWSEVIADIRRSIKLVESSIANLSATGSGLSKESGNRRKSDELLLENDIQLAKLAVVQKYIDKVKSLEETIREHMRLEKRQAAEWQADIGRLKAKLQAMDSLTDLEKEFLDEKLRRKFILEELDFDVDETAISDALMEL